MRDTRWPTPPASGGTGSSPLRSETNASYLEIEMSDIKSQQTWQSTRDIHSSQARDLLGGNGRSHVLQDAPEMFVADLLLPFQEKKKKTSEFWDGARPIRQARYVILNHLWTILNYLCV